MASDEWRAGFSRPCCNSRMAVNNRQFTADSGRDGEESPHAAPPDAGNKGRRTNFKWYLLKRKELDPRGAFEGMKRRWRPMRDSGERVEAVGDIVKPSPTGEPIILHFYYLSRNK